MTGQRMRRRFARKATPSPGVTPEERMKLLIKLLRATRVDKTISKQTAEAILEQVCVVRDRLDEKTLREVGAALLKAGMGLSDSNS